MAWRTCMALPMPSGVPVGRDPDLRAARQHSRGASRFAERRCVRDPRQRRHRPRARSPRHSARISALVHWLESRWHGGRRLARRPSCWCRSRSLHWGVPRNRRLGARRSMPTDVDRAIGSGTPRYPRSALLSSRRRSPNARQQAIARAVSSNMTQAAERWPRVPARVPARRSDRRQCVRAALGHHRHDRRTRRNVQERR